MTKEIYLGNCEDIRNRRSTLDDERFKLDADYIETAPFQKGDIVKGSILPGEWRIERIGIKKGEFVYDVSSTADEEVKTHECAFEHVSGDSLIKIN